MNFLWDLDLLLTTQHTHATFPDFLLDEKEKDHEKYNLFETY